MSAASTFLRRAMLYVPGSSKKMLAKSTSLSIDSVIYDLEDSVTKDSKELARELVADHISSKDMQPGSARGPTEISVRINAVDTGLALQDITQLLKRTGDSLDTIVVPKVQSAADLQFVADVVRHIAPDRSPKPETGPTGTSEQPTTPLHARPLHIIGLIESALGLANLQEICRVGRPLGLSGLGFAAEDFMTSTGLTKLPDRREVLFARSAIVNMCRAYELPSALDMVCVDVGASSTIEEESREGRALGFTGKQAIHPSQVELIQRAFGPQESEVGWAARVVVGDAEARREGRGAWRLDGKMVDAPVVKAAQAMLERARLCGVNVEEYLKAARG